MSVDIIIPVYNEEQRLANSLPRLHTFLSNHCGRPWTITVANNGSTDSTSAVAERFRRELAGVRVLWFPQKGRGGALKRAWLASAADILAYMDVDLATDLAAFPALLEVVASNQADIAIGSRFLRESRTNRSLLRGTISHCYMTLVKAACQVRFSDAQCGFKVLSRAAAQQILPEVEDAGWFFDTELLVRAEHYGWRVAEFPVTWEENPDSRVRIISTAWRDLKGLCRVKRELLARQGDQGPHWRRSHTQNLRT